MSNLIFWVDFRMTSIWFSLCRDWKYDVKKKKKIVPTVSNYFPMNPTDYQNLVS